MTLKDRIPEVIVSIGLHPSRPKEEIISLAKLRAGDHIACMQGQTISKRSDTGYWHHMLVTKVDYVTKQVTVVHMRGVSTKHSHEHVEAVITKESFSMKKIPRDIFYRVIHSSQFSQQRMQIVKTALQWVGYHHERGRNTKFFNCEDFCFFCVCPDKAMQYLDYDAVNRYYLEKSITHEMFRQSTEDRYRTSLRVRTRNRPEYDGIEREYNVFQPDENSTKHVVSLTNLQKQAHQYVSEVPEIRVHNTEKNVFNFDSISCADYQNSLNPDKKYYLGSSTSLYSNQYAEEYECITPNGKVYSKRNKKELDYEQTDVVDDGKNRRIRHNSNSSVYSEYREQRVYKGRNGRRRSKSTSEVPLLLDVPNRKPRRESRNYARKQSYEANKGNFSPQNHVEGRFNRNQSRERINRERYEERKGSPSYRQDNYGRCNRNGYNQNMGRITKSSNNINDYQRPSEVRTTKDRVFKVKEKDGTPFKTTNNRQQDKRRNWSYDNDYPTSNNIYRQPSELKTTKDRVIQVKTRDRPTCRATVDKTRNGSYENGRREQLKQNENSKIVSNNYERYPDKKRNWSYEKDYREQMRTKGNSSLELNKGGRQYERQWSYENDYEREYHEMMKGKVKSNPNLLQDEGRTGRRNDFYGNETMKGKQKSTSAQNQNHKDNKRIDGRTAEPYEEYYRQKSNGTLGRKDKLLDNKLTPKAKSSLELNNRGGFEATIKVNRAGGNHHQKGTTRLKPIETRSKPIETRPKPTATRPKPTETFPKSHQVPQKKREEKYVIRRNPPPSYDETETYTKKENLEVHNTTLKQSSSMTNLHSEQKTVEESYDHEVRQRRRNKSHQETRRKSDFHQDPIKTDEGDILHVKVHITKMIGGGKDFRQNKENKHEWVDEKAQKNHQTAIRSAVTGHQLDKISFQKPSDYSNEDEVFVGVTDDGRKVYYKDINLDLTNTDYDSEELVKFASDYAERQAQNLRTKVRSRNPSTSSEQSPRHEINYEPTPPRYYYDQNNGYPQNVNNGDVSYTDSQYIEQMKNYERYRRFSACKSVDSISSNYV